MHLLYLQPIVSAPVCFSASKVKRRKIIKSESSVLSATVVLSLDEEEGVANDSDSSPPQSRGRGRFEKGRAKVGSRGQSEETRSTSSQAADEESSSHVNALIQRVCFWYVDLANMV